jgi:1-acyl-sn-glycerol-3-phosphate acyltransferase
MTGTERLIVLAESRETDDGTRERLIEQINALAIATTGIPADDVVLAEPHTVLKTSSGKIRRAASRDYYERRHLKMRPPPAWLQIVRLGAAALLPELRHRLRDIAAVIYAGYVWTVFALLAIPTWAAVSLAQRPHLGRLMCHRAAKVMLRLAHIPVPVAGLAALPRTAHLIACNHASYIDAVVLAAILPPAREYVFVAKREFARQPFSRLFFRGIGASFVERTDAMQGVEDVGAVERAALAGALPVFFPEGTFDRQPGLRPFRMGAFLVSAHTGIPIVPAGIRGARSVLRDGSWFPRWSRMAVTFGAPVMPTANDWAAAVVLRDRVRAEIAQLSGEPERV